MQESCLSNNERELRTLFDLLRPRTESTVYDKQHAQIVSRKGLRTASFAEGDVVMADNYGKGDKKIESTVIKQLSPSTYELQIEPSKTWKRHSDHQIIGLEQATNQALRRSERLQNKRGLLS